MMNRRDFMVAMGGLAALSLPRLAAAAGAGETAPSKTTQNGVRKIKDLVIYRHDRFYAAFPSVVRRPDGELLVAFRRAPERRVFDKSPSVDPIRHTDPNSTLVLVRSKDGGETWSREPELIYAHPFGGSQDPCLLQLRDGSLLVTSYGWMLMDPGVMDRIPQTPRAGDYGFMGGYLMKSTDGGRSWQGPIIPPPLPDCPLRDPFGDPLPVFNRGCICEGRDGRLYWVIYTMNPGVSSTHLMISSDGGMTWQYSCPVAQDTKVSFNETSLYETPKGDLVAFMRTDKFDDHTVMARSRDRGRSFEKWQDAGFQGHPHHLTRLEDGRVILVYGYRRPPYGIRARILNEECTNAAAAEEIVLRDDGGSRDLGYPWVTTLEKGRVLVVYYFNQKDGLRHIAGTILEIQ